jgi:hypothetical protein
MIIFKVTDTFEYIISSINQVHEWFSIDIKYFDSI